MLGAPTEVKFGGKFRLTSGNGRYQILSSAWNLRRARGNLSGGELVQWLDPQWRGEELVRVLCTQLIAMVSASEAVEGAYPCPSTQSEDVGKFSAGPWYQVGMGQEWWVPPVPLPSKADTETVFLLFEVCTWGGGMKRIPACAAADAQAQQANESARARKPGWKCVLYPEGNFFSALRVHLHPRTVSFTLLIHSLEWSKWFTQ